MNKFLVFFLFCMFVCSLSAQEQLGLRVGSYAGVNSFFLNPASNVGMPLSWDVSLVEAAAFGQTNYAFVEEAGLLAFWKARKNLLFDVSQRVSEHTPIPGAFLVDFTVNSKKKHFTWLSSVSGPSFFFRLSSGVEVGLISRLRFMAGLYGLPSVLDYYTYEGQPLYEHFSVAPFRASLMAWDEWGLHLGYQWETYYGFFGFGLTGKYLRGYEGAYFSNLSTTEVAKLPGDSLLALSADLAYGLTTTAFQPGDYQFRRTGSGWGVDLGLQWTVEGRWDLYDWKFGMAFLDFGRMQFDRFSEQHRVQVENGTLIVDKDTLSYFQRSEFVETVIRGFSEQVLQNPNASLRSGAFDLWLPSALSLQVEACLYDGFFVQAQFVQRLSFHPGVMRGNLLAITPRYEKKYWGVWFPLSLYNYKELQAGLAIKAGPLVVGTERLAGLFRTEQWDGFDFYAALKVPPFAIQAERKIKRNRRRGKPARCYEF